jgi:proteasome lid subunit RPN8/RPN11
MIKPDRFDVIRIPQTCWSAALEALQTAGARGLEVMVYFAGTFTGAEGVVTRVIVPSQRQSGAGCEPDLDEVNRISADLVRAGEVLLWQLHSHPSAAYLSGTDRSWPVSRKTGWISAVAPSFGEGVTTPVDIRAYEYLGGDDWHEFDREERDSRLVIM